MPSKEKTFNRVVFTPEIIKQAAETIVSSLPRDQRIILHETLSVDLPSGEKWYHDGEDEFFADYRSGFKWARFERRYGNYNVNIRGVIALSASTASTEVTISMPSRADVERVFGILEFNVENCRLPVPPPEKAPKPRNMPKKNKRYERVIFTPDVIREADDMVRAILRDKQAKPTSYILSVEVRDGERWSHDNEEEFFADYRRGPIYAYFQKSYSEATIAFVTHGTRETNVEVAMSSRADVEKVFDVFESNVEKCRLPVPPLEKAPKPKVKIFIGHGQNPHWRDLKDHLHEKHGLDVEAYEIGARAGLTVKEVLDDMLSSSSLALLVLTGEDLDAVGELHARENVIHELGLFQGRLGWRKAIALLEEDTEEFSNIHGVNQIRFKRGNIQETFGEVLATIKREFPEG